MRHRPPASQPYPHRTARRLGALWVCLVLVGCLLGGLLVGCEVGGAKFSLPTYTEHIGERGKGTDGYYGASNGLSYSLAIGDGGQYYTVEGIGACTDVDIVIPDTYDGLPVRGVEAQAFRNDRQLLSVMFGNNIVRIGDGAFMGCVRLMSVTLGEAVVSIGEGAFGGCTRLKEVGNYADIDIQRGSLEYGMVGFYADNIYTKDEGHSNLFVDARGFVLYRTDHTCTLVDCLQHIPDVTVPDEVTDIDEFAFADDPKLVSVTLPIGVHRIHANAFEGCTNLTYVSMGDGLVSIATNAFCGCTALQRVRFSTNLTYIHDLAFAECRSLRQVELPDSVCYLSSYAFLNCSALRMVSLGKGITSLDPTVFAGCHSLSEVQFSLISRWHRGTDPEDERRNNGVPVTEEEMQDAAANAEIIRQARYYWYRG